jgi:hypothetical protein
VIDLAATIPLDRLLLVTHRGFVLSPEQHRILRHRQAPMIDAQTSPVRPMVVVLDNEIAESNDPAARYLRGLLDADNPTQWRYADDGPNQEARTLASPRGSERYAPGWIELRRHGQAYVALLATPTTVTEASAWPGWQDIGVAVASLGGAGTADDKLADVLAALAAASAAPDMFVTARDGLLRTKSTVVREAHPYDLHDAISLVGLHLRTSDQYFVGTEDRGIWSPSRYNRGLFYFVAARGLTPAGWRWFSACVDSGDESLVLLAQSVLERVDRSLRIRDDIYRWLLLPQNNDTADEALAQLDALMFTLHGAFDAAARVAHRVLQLPGRTRFAGWHHSEWQGQVDAAGGGHLVDLVRVGTSGAALLQVIRSLRNTVHGEATRAVAVLGSATSGGLDTQLALPSDEADMVLRAVDVLGERERWGIREVAPTRLLIRVPAFIEQIVRPAYNLLNNLLDRTPVEQVLDGRSASFAGPPEDDDAFSPARTQRILWQLGL